ncbi:hypothetical protein [Egbenema bharatensis]|uniref:hypothetical protein n=1 Tax=Egbenema bharatensis TaxID=3463334 RepID=UPI003A8626D9
MMTLSVANPEQWNTEYDAASVKQQYDMLLDALSQPLTPDLIEDLDLGLLLAMMRDELVHKNQLEKAVALLHVLHQQQPEFHQAEFPFLDSLLIEYFLYKNDLEQVREGLGQFLLNPVEDIDQTLMTLDYLKLYDARDLAIELCQAAYEPVKDSPMVIRGTEMEFSNVLLYDRMQRAYEQLQQDESVDWDAFLEETVRYGFPKKPKWIAEIQQSLTTEVEKNPAFLAQFKRDRAAALRTLSIGFYQYMAKQKQMSFVCSYAIWKSVVNFLDNRQIPNKKLSQPELYFAFEQDDLDYTVHQMIGGLLSMTQAIGFGLLWGMSYVYDFLLAKQMISDQVHQQAMTGIHDLKSAIVEDYPKLWRFDFVHRWQPPDSVSAEEFAAEASRFAASLEPVEPLSDEPGGGLTEQSFIDSLKRHMPPDVQEALAQLMAKEDNFAEADEEEYVPPIVRFQEPDYDYEPPKKPKSALKLASELPDKTPKSSKRKKR